MTGLADPHNFGRCVEKTSLAGVAYFSKPRPIFWEWFFFGKAGPLAKELAPELDFFSLETLSDDLSKSGLSLSLEAASIAPSSSSAFAFGQTLAYCYAFGIQDVHSENILNTQEGPRIIDAEQVFSDLKLPEETLLLPFKNTSYIRSGIGRILPESFARSETGIKEILRGYFFCLELLAQKQNLLQSIFQNFSDEMRRTPIRVILRDTRSYQNFTKESFKTPLLPEEKIQLERGDIPYFFKFLDDDSLYFHASSDGEIAKVIDHGDLDREVKRAANNPMALLNSFRLLNELAPTGALAVVRKLNPNQQNFIFEEPKFRLSANAKKIDLFYRDCSFTTIPRN
jgi:hypothetical protein